MEAGRHTSFLPSLLFGSSPHNSVLFPFLIKYCASYVIVHPDGSNTSPLELAGYEFERD
jgi:hypothetical protein